MFKSVGFKLIWSYFILHEDSQFFYSRIYQRDFLLTIVCWQKYEDLFLVLYSISLVFMSEIQRVFFFLDYFIFTMYFKIRHFDVSSFVLLTQAVFG